MIATALLFLSLGLDTVAVAIGLGLAGLPRDRWVRVGLTFAAFEGAMPLIGLIAGLKLTHALGSVAGYGAGLLLIAVGGLEIKESLADKDDDDDDEEKAERVSSLTGKALIYTGLSVSMDELAVGFSLGVIRAPLIPSLVYIGAQAFVVTFIGLSLGKRLGERIGEGAELLAGIALAILGVILIVNEALGGRFL